MRTSTPGKVLLNTDRVSLISNRSIYFTHLVIEEYSLPSRFSHSTPLVGEGMVGARNFPSPQLKEPIETEKMSRISIFLPDVNIWVFFPMATNLSLTYNNWRVIEEEGFTYALDIMLNRIHEIVPLINYFSV